MCQQAIYYFEYWKPFISIIRCFSFDPSAIVCAPLVLKFNWRQSKMYSSLLVDIKTELETIGYKHIAPHCLHARYT